MVRQKCAWRWPGWWALLLVCCGSGILGCAGRHAPQTTVPDNLSFVDALLDEALAPLVTDLTESAEAAPALRVCVGSTVGHAEYLEERLLRALAGAGLRVLLCAGAEPVAAEAVDVADADAGDDAERDAGAATNDVVGEGVAERVVAAVPAPVTPERGGAEVWRLNLDLLALRLRYESRSGFFSAGRTRRFADVAFSATLADDQGVLRLQERYAADSTDEVESAALARLERGPLRATGAKDAAPGFLAPVVAVGVALGMTFLLIGTHNEG